MLADLARIRELQVLQRQALVDADGQRLGELDRERAAVTARLVPLASAGLSTVERETADRLVAEISADQDALMRTAEEIRTQVGRELGGIGSGREALRGYQVQAATSSAYVDRAY